VQVWEAPNNASYNYLTSYSYDVLGNLISVTQGVQTRSFVYDSLGRLSSASNPEVCNGAGTPIPVTYQYGPNGNLTQKTDARGITTTFSYDALNRVTLRDYSDTTPDVSYAYDTATNGQGRLSAVSSSVSVTSYTGYDALGRVTASRQTTDGQDYTFSYSYDRAGNLTSQTYPSGKVMVSEYDSAGRLAGVKRQGGSYYAGAAASDSTNRLQYSAHGAVSALRLGNQLWEHTTFNTRLQPVQIGLGTSATDSSKLQLDYTYGTTNNNGNVLSQTITLPGLTLTQSYTYDELNRLKSAQEQSGSSWKQTYLYDRYGNRTFDAANSTYPAPLTNPSINQSNNRLSEGQGYAYDLAGNLTSVPNQSFAYDAENRLRSASGGNSYSYDGNGRRVKKVDSSGTTVFVYNAVGQLIAEYTSSAVQGSGGTSYVTADTLGTPRVMTDNGGGVKARHDYLPFGEEVGAIGGRSSQQQYVIDAVRQKFTGYERDMETGLDYAQARYYASAQGRFTSPDPLLSSARATSPQTWNRYAYVLNRPLSLVDPSGLSVRAADGGCAAEFSSCSEEEGGGSGALADYESRLEHQRNAAAATRAARDGDWETYDELMAADSTLTIPDPEQEQMANAHEQAWSYNSMMIIIWEPQEGSQNPTYAFGHVSAITMANDESLSWESFKTEWYKQDFNKKTPSSLYTGERSRESAGRGYILDFGVELNKKFIKAYRAAYDAPMIGKIPYHPFYDNCGYAFTVAINAIHKDIGVKSSVLNILPKQVEGYIKDNLQPFWRATHVFPKH
jgi:RHS repeat-associated protein